MLGNSEIIQNNHSSHSVIGWSSDLWESRRPAAHGWCPWHSVACCFSLICTFRLNMSSINVSSSDLISLHKLCPCCWSTSNKPACAAHTHHFFPPKMFVTLHFSLSYPFWPLHINPEGELLFHITVSAGCKLPLCNAKKGSIKLKIYHSAIYSSWACWQLPPKYTSELSSEVGDAENFNLPT